MNYEQTSDWGEVRSSNCSSPHFFCEVWGEDPQFFLCEEWGEVPQFHYEVEEKRYSSLFLNLNTQIPPKANFFFTLGRSVECHQFFCFFLMSPNFFLIRCAKIFSSIFRGARKTLKNCANCKNFANSEIECEEWGEEKNDMRMRSSPPWPMRFEVWFLNFFSMRNEVRTSTKSKRGQMSAAKFLHIYFETLLIKIVVVFSKI